MSTAPNTLPPQGTGSRIRKTFGPALVGLIGGGLTGLGALADAGPLARNVASTYAHFPALRAPQVFSLDLPPWGNACALLVAIAGVVGTGALVAWRARPRDLWDDLSAGLSAGLAATLAAFVSCFGWSAVLAWVVVPSIADLTLATDTAPASRSLVEHYPDLAKVEPGRRGGIVMAKIVADQVSGATKAVWAAVLLSALTAGLLAMAGTLAAGYLRRQGARLQDLLFPYLELTIPTAVTFGLLATESVSSIRSVLGRDNPTPVAGLLLTAAATAFLMLGAIARWPALVRVCLAITWVVLGFQVKGSELPWWMTALAAVPAGVLLLRHWLASRGRLAPLGASA